MLRGMLHVLRSGCSSAPEEILHVALTGCKIFYNHVTRFIPYGRERINAVNIFSSFNKIKVTKILALANKCARMRVLLQSPLNQYLKGFILFSTADPTLMSTVCPVQQQPHCSNPYSALLCLHSANKQACEPFRAAVGTEGQRNTIKKSKTGQGISESAPRDLSHFFFLCRT